MPREKAKNSQDLTETERAYEKAIDLLSRRMHSSAELRRKLELRGFSKEAIAHTITKIRDLGFINDETFAQTYINNLIRNKTFGYYGIKAKLMQRGIEPSIAQQLLSESLDLDTEIKLAKKFLRGSQRDKQKTAAALARRGFRNEVISDIVKNSFA